MANEADAVILRNATQQVYKVVVPDLSGAYATNSDLATTNAAVTAAQADASQAIADAAAASDAASAAQATADGKIVTFYQATAPTADGVGDLWVDSDDNQLYRWDGSVWGTMQDNGIVAAITAADNAQATADGKIVTFYQTSAPTASALGDLWVDTDDSNHLYRWSGSAWVSVRDTTIAAAQADASTAIANAATAQSAADAAQATADGKVVTFYQSTAPTADGVGDLWIDSDDKKMYRWNGTSWVDSQDTQIGTALANAANAQATADGKIVTFYQTSAPTAVAVGDLWVDTDDSNRLYRWSGSAWVSVRDTTIDTKIPSIGAVTGGKSFRYPLVYSNNNSSVTDNLIIDTPITFGAYMCKINISGFNYSSTNNIKIESSFYAYNVGPAFVNTSTVSFGNKVVTVRLARKISTGTVSIILTPTSGAWQYPKLTVESALVSLTTPPDSFLSGWSVASVAEASIAASYDLVTTPAVRDVLTEITSAQSAATTAQTTADGKNTVFYATSAPTANKVNDLWFDTDDGNKPYKWSGSAWVAATFGDSAISGLNVGKLVAGEIAAGQKIIAGPSAGTHAEMTDSGFYAYVDDPVDGTPNIAIRMGTSDSDLLTMSDASGNTTASIADTGYGSLSGLNVDNDPTVDGTPLIGLTGNTLPDIVGFVQDPVAYDRDYDANPLGIIEQYSKGTVAWGQWDGTDFTQSITGNQEMSLFELGFDCEPGRQYAFRTSPIIVNTSCSAVSYVGLRIRYTNDGTSPSLSSTLNTVDYQSALVASGAVVSLSCPLRLFNGGATSQTQWRVLVSVFASANMTTCTVANSQSIMAVIEDLGPVKVITGDVRNYKTGGTTGGGAAVKKTYTKTYASTSAATYNGSGVKRTDTTDVVQGTDPSGFNGDGKGLWIFPSMTADLSGATINKVEVYCYANHWYYNSGGSAIIKVHGYTAAPASSPTLTTCKTVTGWPNPGGKWVTLPSSFYAGFGSGTYRGFGLGPSGGSNLLYYGRFNGGTGARIRVTYTK